MATTAAKIVDNNDGTRTATWLAVTEADTGAAVACAGWFAKTVQVSGDFTTSGAITIEGSSNGGLTYATLHDTSGTTLVITSDSVRPILESPLLIRPRATAGTAVAMDVYITGVK